MTVPGRSRCEADSQCAEAPQHTSPSGSRELEYAGPIKASARSVASSHCTSVLLSLLGIFYYFFFFLGPHELLITQQAQYVGIPDAGVITQSKMASDNAGLAWHNEPRQHHRARSHVSPRSAHHSLHLHHVCCSLDLGFFFKKKRKRKISINTLQRQMQSSKFSV